MIAQTHREHPSHEQRLQQLIPTIPYLAYDSDSVSGFNEPAALANAIEEGFSQENTERYIYLKKREFIKTKYAINPISNFKTFPPTPQAPCTNIDFETGTTAGWTTSGDAVIKSGTGLDPFGGFPVVCPGGNFSLQLGNNTNVATSIARQTFAVTPANAYFVLKFAMVILNFPHTASDAARVFIRFKDGAGTVIACPNFECYYAETSTGGGQSYGLTGFQTGANGVNIGAQSYPTTYVPWTNLGFDLTPYVGQNITVEIENRWCVYNYDWAYCYVDGLCSTLSTSVTGGCAGASTGTLTAPAGMDNYAWAGPGGSSVASVTTQTATTTVPGIYTVTCTPYSSCGTATYVYTLNFSPNAAPTADFTYTVTPCASSFSVPVLSTSLQNGGGPITSYTWDWGDGSAFGTGASTVHTYGSIGTKTVELKVSNGACTDSITKTFSFTVGPIASFTNTSGCLNTTTNFSSTTTPTTGITAHLWDFGDGSPTGTGANPSHVYTTPGNKVVTYTVVSASCQNSVTHTITVYPNPVSSITGNTVCLNVSTTFGNTSSVSAPDNITGWAWDFNNDGVVDNTTQTPTNTYTAAGTYTVELRATTNNGCKDSTTIQVKVNPLPTATFSPVNACVNSNVVLNNTSSIASPDNIQTTSWNFGAGANPATGTGTNVTPLVYTTPGIKNITLNLTSNNSCTATITQTVEVYAQPVANFSTTSVCQGTATAYTDLSTPTGSITNWAWDFTNNGSTDNTTNAPSNLFSPSGTYTTGLVVTDNHGCKDTTTSVVNVWGHAIPDFVPSNVCFGSASTFSNTTNTSTNANVGGTPTWAWNFGDGSATNTLQDPTYTYTSTVITNYNVTLTVTTTNGCVDNITKNVIVNVIPTATFTPVNACMNSNVLLNNASSVPLPDNISSYSWNFGTGAAPTTTSNVQNPPLLTYNSSGVKTITLTITANTTCSASITKTVTVYPQPVANFSTTSVCQGTATAYTDLSTPTGSITAWAWDFTNNGSIDNVTNAPTNIYPISGTFTAGLIVTDNNTCKDTIKLAVDVWGHTIPNFTPDKVCFGTASLFTNLTDETTNPNVGTGTTYVWDFADASGTTTIVNPSHTYTLGGNANATYNVTLTATSLHNCVDVTVKPVSVYAIPTASFTSDSVCLGSPSHLNSSSSNGNGNVINTYEWDYLSDGTVDITGVANPNFVFPAFGNNNVSFTVSTSPVIGLVCSNMTNTIQVWVNPIPQPDFTFVNNCINAQPNTFNGSASMIAIGTNTAFVWAYGDGAVSTPTTASTSTHSYAAAGTYNATLTLTSNKGCQNTVVKAVEVYEKPKMAITNSTPCDQSAMTFTAVSQAGSGTVTNWYWDFNNSITSVEGTGQTTNFTFAGPGDYTIHLVSETNHGCRDTIQQGVYVNYLPQPDFTVNDPDGCPKHCVKFTDMTPVIPGPATLATWSWTLGDGSNTVVNNTNGDVEHCYINNSSSQLAQYSVQLMVTTSAGCSVTVTKSNYITVFPKPIAQYEANPNPSNVTEPLVFFTNQSIDYTKWWWMYGDNTPLDSLHLNPEHFYSDATAQTYYSVLLVSNQYGCLDTAYLPVEIGPEFTFYIPNAFTPSNDDGINDYFNGTGIGIEKYEMWIFDRWGERVFYTDDLKKGWDGRVQGKSKEGKQDVYTWKVKLTDVLGKKHDYVGHVTLIN